MWVEGSCSWEPHDWGLDSHAHGNRPEQGRPGPRREKLSELLTTHPKVPHVTWTTEMDESRFILLRVLATICRDGVGWVGVQILLSLNCNAKSTLHLLHQYGPLQHGIGGNDGGLGRLAQVDHPRRRCSLGRHRNGSV